MLQIFKNGQGSIVLRVKLLDSTVSTGAGKTGLTSASSGLIISTIADNEATATAYTVAGSTIESITTLGTYAAPTATKCRFKEVDATNHKGIYEIQIADARFAVSSAKSLLVSISGVTGMAEADGLVQLQSDDPYVAKPANFALTSIDANGRVDVIKVAGTTQTAKDIGAAVPAAVPGAAGGLQIAGSNAATTYASLTVTGATTLTGNVALADGLTIAAPSTGNRAGLDITGNGTGAAVKLAAGATGKGIAITTTAGDGLSILPTAGHGIVATGNGTSKHGAILTGGTAGTSDGLVAAAGTGGVDFRANQTGNLTGTVATLTTYTGNTPQTGDNFARLGAPAGASVSADVAAVKADTAAVKASQIIQTGTAAAGGAATITLQTALGADSLPNGCLVAITAGTGVGQARVITGYVNATKVATVGHNWTTNPDNTSVYYILNADTAKVDSSLKVAGVVLTDTLTTYTGNTPQTGDSFARLGAPAGASVSADIAAVQADTDNLQTRVPAALVGGRMDSSVGAVANDAITAAAIAADAGTEIGTAVWASGTRVLTAGTNIALAKGTGVTGFNDLSAAAVNAEVDTAIADAALATAANLATVAGYLDTEIAAILADTNELQTDWADGGRLDLILDARASQASVDDLPTNAELATALGTADDAVLAILGTPAGASLSADVAAVKSQTAAIETDTQDIQTRLPAALVGGRIDASVGAMAANTLTASALAADAVTEIQSGLATGASLAAVDAVTDKLDAMIEVIGSPGEYAFTTVALSQAPTSGGGGATAADIADAVWDEVLSGHAGAGSAGKIIGDNVNATISSRATQASVDTIDAIVDAILVDTAEIGAAGAGLTALASAANLATVAGYVDTEVAAIKAKTDQMVFTVANQLDVNVLDWKSATAPAMTGDAFARLGAPAGASVSADIAAVQADTDNVQTRLPAALVSGRMDASVGAMAANVMTAAAAAADLTTELQTGLATAAALSTVSTATVAIQAKTDNLPSDPADASDVASSFGAIASTLSTIAGYIDTEVGAIKAKTDNLPSDPADASDVAAAVAAVKLYADRTVIRGTVSGTSPTTTTFTASALSPAGVDADQFKGRIVIFDNDTTTTSLRGQATNILTSSAAGLPEFTFSALTIAPQDGDTFSIV